MSFPSRKKPVRQRHLSSLPKGLDIMTGKANLKVPQPFSSGYESRAWK